MKSYFLQHNCSEFFSVISVQLIHPGRIGRNNTITISAMALLMLLPLPSSVSIAGEGLNLKLDYSLTNEQST